MSKSNASDGRVGNHTAGSRGDQPSLQPSLDEMNSKPIARGEANFDSLSSSAKEAAWTATRAVRQQAQAVVADVGHELSVTAEQQKQRGVEAIQGVVRAIHTAADELDGETPAIAGYVRDAADKIDSLSSNIADRDVHQLLRSASDLARSQPVLFFGGAVVAGFALSRFLKSSSAHEATGSRDSSHSQVRSAAS